MGKDREYRDRLEAVLAQLNELTTVRAIIEDLQNADYRRALRWSGERVYRREDRHLRAILKRQEGTLERIKHAIGSAGWDLDALVPMPGGVSHMRMTYANWAKSAYWGVRSRGQEVDELVGTIRKCATLTHLWQLFLDILTSLPASIAIDIRGWNDI